MTEREAIARLRDIAAWGESQTYAQADACYRDADGILIEFLRHHGCDPLADAWEEVHERCWLPYGG